MEVETGVGGWKAGPHLPSGSYLVVPKAAGYLSLPGSARFVVPEKGLSWRYSSLNFEMFRPEDAQERFGMPLCEQPKTSASEDTSMPPSPPTPTPMPPGPPGPGANVCFGGYGGMDWHFSRGMSGTVAGLAAGAVATVRIERLPRVEGECYYRGGPASPGCTYPQEVTMLDDLSGLEQGEAVTAMEVTNGQWGLIDPALGGSRYLVTLDVPGYTAEPRGYVVVVFTGHAPHRAQQVDFSVGKASEE